MAESKFAEWQRIYQEALNETDQGKLIPKICEAESVLFLRLQEMPYRPTHKDEAMAIYDAVHSLRLLRCDLNSRSKRDEASSMWKKTA